MVETYALGKGQILLGNYLFDSYDVEIKPHGADYELFESYEGLISIRKMLDKHTEITFKTLITESVVKGYDPDNPNEANRKAFIEYRRKFLDEVDGKNVVVVSEMFKPFSGVVTSREYSVAGGETAVEYKVEVKEAGGTVG